MTFIRSLTRHPDQARKLGLLFLVVMLFLAAFDPRTLPAALAADPVFVGAGDIAKCGSALANAEATAKLLDTINGTVFAAGDIAYTQGTDAEFASCYDPTWGRHRARTRPVPGNHEYGTPGATGYFNYFGAAAGDPSKGYYSYNLGAWHIIALNSQCTAVGGCGPGTPQEKWLRADLAAHPATCTLAYWHHPRFSSSSTHPNDARTQALWQALYVAGADIVVSGHAHNYERFAPQDSNGVANPKGIREFVVGTGGESLTPFGTVQPTSEVRSDTSYGVLKLTLHATSYDWEFVPIAGATFRDSGSTACVQSGQPPTPTPTVSNYLTNWSFEIDNSPQDGKPDGWNTLSSFTRSSAIPAHNGSFVGRLSDTGNVNYTLSQTVSGLTAGASYTLSGWVNIPAQNDPTFVCKLQVRWLGADNSVIGTDTVTSYTSPTSGWEKASKSQVAPRGTSNARVQVVASSLNGTIYLDQFVFRP